MAVISKPAAVGPRYADDGDGKLTPRRRSRLRRGIRGLHDRVVELLFRRPNHSGPHDAANAQRWSSSSSPPPPTARNGVIVGHVRDSPPPPENLLRQQRQLQHAIFLSAMDCDPSRSVQFEESKNWPWIDDDFVDSVTDIQYSWWH